MRLLAVLLIASIVIVSCTNNQSQLSENSLIGTWECVSGCDADIYVFSKSKQGFEFTAYKQQNILKAGNYNCTDSTLSFSYLDGATELFSACLRNDSLILEDGNLILKRYIENTDFSNHTDQLIGEMESLLAVFPDFDYTNQEPVDFTYKMQIVEDQYEPVTVKGLKMRSKVALAGEFLNKSDVLDRITKVLEEQGFLYDKVNSTNDCIVYVEGTMVVQICSTETHQDETSGELDVVVCFGFIN